jgi:hypothetical protein
VSPDRHALLTRCHVLQVEHQILIGTLHSAVVHGHAEEVLDLLEEKADVNGVGGQSLCDDFGLSS